MARHNETSQGEVGAILPNLCDRGVDFQSFCDPGGTLSPDVTIIQPKMKKRGKQEMTWHNETSQRQTHEMRGGKDLTQSLSQRC